MAKFNVVSKIIDGEKYYFVSKGNAKITDEDIDDFMSLSKAGKKPLEIPESRKKIFYDDLKAGIKFCQDKYAASKKEIMWEAARLFPELRLENLED